MNKIIKYNNHSYELFIENIEIISKIKKIAHNLNDVYLNKEVVFIGILNGCIEVLEELVKHLHFKYKIEYIDLSSYVGTTQKKIIHKNDTMNTNLNGKNIILVDDIIDGGNTMKYSKKYIMKYNPRNVRVISLLLRKKTKSLCDWYGFEIKNKYVIGYGMDIDNLFRDLKDIYIQID